VIFNYEYNVCQSSEGAFLDYIRDYKRSSRTAFNVNFTSVFGGIYQFFV